MWIGIYGLGVVLELIRALSVVIQDEKISDLGQVTFSKV